MTCVPCLPNEIIILVFLKTSFLQVTVIVISCVTLPLACREGLKIELVTVDFIRKDGIILEGIVEEGLYFVWLSRSRSMRESRSYFRKSILPDRLISLQYSMEYIRLNRNLFPGCQQIPMIECHMILFKDIQVLLLQLCISK